jgi:hypothetical protein
MTQNELSVSEIFEKIEEAKTIIETPWELVPFKVREGWNMGVTNAKESIGSLIKQVKERSIPSRLIGIFATGSNEGLLALHNLVKTGDGLVINANQVYIGLAQELEPSFGSDRIFKPSTFMQFVSLYRNLCEDNGIINCPSLPYFEANCPTSLDTINHVKIMVRSAVRDDLTIKVLTKELIDGIIKGELDGKYIPVMVTQASEEDRKVLSKLFVKTVDMQVDTAEDATQENVTKLVKEALGK